MQDYSSIFITSSENTSNITMLSELPPDFNKTFFVSQIEEAYIVKNA